MQIKVNADDWNGISEVDRKTIQEIMSKSFKGDPQIVKDTQAPAVTQSTDPAAELDGICTSLCTVAQSAVEALCGRIGNATVKQVCLVAAQVAGDACRSKC
ncbi:MAG TPA: hypothetical protein VGO82_07495 [Enterovirga sp.]|jgi:hypothetical protein|nr:hypothetical protein [Enterovirga sp.]